MINIVGGIKLNSRKGGQHFHGPTGSRVVHGSHSGQLTGWIIQHIINIVAHAYLIYTLSHRGGKSEIIGCSLHRQDLPGGNACLIKFANSFAVDEEFVIINITLTVVQVEVRVVGQVHMGGFITFGPEAYAQLIIIIEGVLYFHQQVAGMSFLTIGALIAQDETDLLGCFIH